MDSTKRRRRKFKVEVLPKQGVGQNSLLGMASVLRDFRLEALRTTPDAFASTYEIEVQYQMEHWLQRLENPDAWHIVATEDWDHDGIGQSKEDHFRSRPWYGLILVMAKRSMKRGNAATSPWTHHMDITSNVVDKQQHYQLHGTFVHPSARRCGIGTLLVQQALSFVKSILTEQTVPSVRVDVLVDSENTAAQSLYQSCGFQFVECDEYEVNSTKRTAWSMSVVLHSNI